MKPKSRVRLTGEPGIRGPSGFLVLGALTIGLVSCGTGGHQIRARSPAPTFAVEAGRWTRIAPSPLGGRNGAVAVWTGTKMLVWGGADGESLTADGAAYDPSTDSWPRLPPSPIEIGPDARGAWTGKEAIVWRRTEGAAYNPDTRHWRRLPPFPFKARDAAAVLLTGDGLVVWGGVIPSAANSQYMSDGAIYRPGSDRWFPMAPSPLIGRVGTSAAWTGREVILWGGAGLNDGAAYDISTHRWRRLAPSPLSPRAYASAVWTGREVIFWGSEHRYADGAAYDPETDKWRLLAPAPLAGRGRHTAAWTGSRMLIWGGMGEPDELGDGASYDPQHDSWVTLPRSPLAARTHHAWVWTGDRLIVWGGLSFQSGDPQPNDGATYAPTEDRPNQDEEEPQCEPGELGQGMVGDFTGDAKGPDSPEEALATFFAESYPGFRTDEFSRILERPDQVRFALYQQDRLKVLFIVTRLGGGGWGVGGLRGCSRVLDAARSP